MNFSLPNPFNDSTHTNVQTHIRIYTLRVVDSTKSTLHIHIRAALAYTPAHFHECNIRNSMKLCAARAREMKLSPIFLYAQYLTFIRFLIIKKKCRAGRLYAPYSARAAGWKIQSELTALADRCWRCRACWHRWVEDNIVICTGTYLKKKMEYG